MASPPFAHNLFSQHSPPYPPNVSLPPKRRTADMPSSAPAVKRRKTSMLSTTSATSNHPLRQTSFPPENANAIIGTPRFSRSPSVDTMSLASASVAGGPKKKRGRKPKKELADDESAVGRKAKSEVSGVSGGRKRKQSVSSGADDDEEGGEDMALNMIAASEEEKKKEREHIAMLTNAFDPEQFERYEAWRASKLQVGTVRRIVNQTLSQSVPENVVNAVRAVAKVFAGDMIESARRVQAQWNYSDEELKEAIRNKMEQLPTPPAEIPAEVMNEEKRLPAGPLLPDHLREAYRRHKAGQEGGSVGQMNLWHMQAQTGVERFGTKTGGKRLFK